MTGWVLWTDGNREEGELQAERFLDHAARLINGGKVDTVVCERYVVTVRTATLTQAPWSLESIGVLRFLCRQAGIEFHLQNVGDAKRFATDQRLNSLGWRKPPGAGHARDAQRHLLIWLVRKGWTDDRLVLS